METPCLDFLGDAPGQHRVPAAVLAAREDRLALQPEALDREEEVVVVEVVTRAGLTSEQV